MSARNGDGLEPLRADLAALLPEGPRYFEDGRPHGPAARARIAELVREKALALTREEVPHAISVEVDELDASGGRVRRASSASRPQSQKEIVVGKGGA